jgi:hypothetical protein
MRAEELLTLLRRTAVEIREQDICGWGNAIDLAIEYIEAEVSLQSGSAGGVDDTAARMWRAEAEKSGTPASVAANRTRDAFDSQSDELKARWRKFAEAALVTPAKAAGEWRDISTAPKDGTNILVKTVTFGWSSDICQNVATGYKWVEARWAPDLIGEHKWLEWCGNERTHTTDWLTPVAWVPLPTSPSPDGERQEGGAEGGGPADNWTRNKDGAIIGGPGGGGYYD